MIARAGAAWWLGAARTRTDDTSQPGKDGRATSEATRGDRCQPDPADAADTEQGRRGATARGGSWRPGVSQIRSMQPDPTPPSLI